MTQLKVDQLPTDFTCGECGAPVVLRIEKFDSWGRKNIVRSREHVCSALRSHDVGDLVITLPRD